MIIDLVPADHLPGAWWVIAHMASGDAHDIFPTRAAALDFARNFYGGQLMEASNASH